jgi:hypothetical protein
MKQKIIALLAIFICSSAIAYNSNWQTGFVDDAFAILKFTEGSGAVATDDSTNHCNAVLNPVTWTNRPGAGGAISCPTSYGYFTNDAVSDVEHVTVCAWICATNAIYDFLRITEKSYLNSYMFAIIKDGSLYSAIYCKGQEQIICQIPTNEWVHVAFTHDGTNDYFYKNGLCVDTNADSQVWSAPSTRLSIGGDIAATERFQGLIGEMLFSHEAYTPERILLHYTETVADTNVVEKAGPNVAALLLYDLMSEEE